MRILTRYVLSELLKVFLVSLAGMTLFLLLVGLFREAYNQGLGLKQVLQLIPYVLPEALRFSVPATMLFAAAAYSAVWPPPTKSSPSKPAAFRRWCCSGPPFRWRF